MKGIKKGTYGRLVCFLWLGIALMSVGCNHRGPQRPSQRSGTAPKEDSAALALMEMNQRMAMAADEEVLRYVQAREDAERFAQMPLSSAWVRIVERGDEQSALPQKDEVWRLHIKTYSLQGRLLLDTEQEYRMGRSELPMCIEMNISEWHHEAKVMIAAPWYAAYGMMGTEDVPAYENVLLEISIL
ncbi:MAG: hypothetical protein ACI4BD_04540 [Paludibacteraceae bacterium]